MKKMKFISKHQKKYPALHQFYFNCNLHKLISSKLEAAPIAEEIGPVI